MWNRLIAHNIARAEIDIAIAIAHVASYVSSPIKLHMFQKCEAFDILRGQTSSN